MNLPLSIIILTLLLLAFGLTTNASPILSLSIEARADAVVPVSNEPRGLPLYRGTFIGFIYHLSTEEMALPELLSENTVGGYLTLQMKRADKEFLREIIIKDSTWKECPVYSLNIKEQGVKKVLVEPAKPFLHCTPAAQNSYLRSQGHNPSETVLLLLSFDEGPPVVAISTGLTSNDNPLKLSVGKCLSVDKITGTEEQVDWESWDYVKMTGPES
jgi:hypothetical protein